MKKIIFLVVSLLMLVMLLPNNTKAEENSNLSFMIQSDYETVTLIYDSEELSDKTHFTINGSDAEAEYTYLDDYRADVVLDTMWFDKEIEISFYNGETLLETKTVLIPSLNVENDKLFELNALIPVSEENSLRFKPQKDGRYLFLPSGSDLSRITFEYDAELIKNLTVTNALMESRVLTVNSGEPVNLEQIERFENCTVDFYRFNYEMDDNNFSYTVGVMVSENVESVFFDSADPENKGRDYIDDSVDHSTKAKGIVTLYDNSLNEEYSGVVSAIKGRGNTTWNWADKKSYQIKLDKKADLLDPKEGNQKAKKWILLSSPFDGTLMRNQLFLSLGYNAGLLETPEGKPVDFYYDGEYRGTYILCEKAEIGDGRIEIEDLEKANEKANPEIEDFDGLEEADARNKYNYPVHYELGINNPENISGGYLIEMDNAYGANEKSYFIYKNNPIVSKSPEYLSLEEVNYMSEFFIDAFNSAYEGGINSQTGKAYNEYFDMRSLVRYFIIQQLGKNLDAYVSSTFFYKPMDVDVVYSGPLWDMDSTCGARSRLYSPDGWRMLGLASALWEIDSFREAVREYYNSEFRTLIQKEVLGKGAGSWFEQTVKITSSAEMNFTLWNVFDAEGTFRFRDSLWQNTTDLFNWLEARIEWLDSNLSDKVITRISGNDRYDTAMKIADELKERNGVEKFETIILASGIDFPDALCSSYLALQKDAPILLIHKASRNKVIKYINNNLAENGVVIVLGGNNAVDESYLVNLKGSYIRLSGDDRYATNLKILEYIGKESIHELLICTGKSYADCLSASAVSVPILLVKDKLTNAQKKYLSTLNLDNIFVVGGQEAVNENIFEQLKEYGNVERIYGSDRYGTSVAIANRFFNGSNSAVFAYSENFPDGLCGGPLAGKLNAPILLAKTSRINKLKSYVSKNNVSNGYVLGGEILISDEALKKLFDGSVPPHIIQK